MLTVRTSLYVLSSYFAKNITNVSVLHFRSIEKHGLVPGDRDGLGPLTGKLEYPSVGTAVKPKGKTGRRRPRETRRRKCGK